MKLQLSEVDRRLIERVCDIICEQTGVDEENWIEVDDILAILDSLEDKYQDLKDSMRDIKENYKPCDINDNWNYYATTIQRLEKECKKQYDFIKMEGLKDKYDRI